MVETQGHILIVDDNELNREILARRLERHGYTYATAEDGVEALELMRAQPFDLVLLDIMMPRMNGYEVLESAKTDPGLQEIPIVVISAVNELESVVKCIELGAEDYLFKPFNPVLLRARLNACLEKKRLRKEAQSTGESVTNMRQSLENVRQYSSDLLSRKAGDLTAEQTRIVTVIDDCINTLIKQVAEQ